MTFTIISAVNDSKVLESCLLRSPDVLPLEKITQTGFSSASAAYNRALEKATGQILIFVHQDVYLPPGWLQRLQWTIQQLESTDPDWGVLGVCGLTERGELCSWVYSSGLGAVVGKPFPAPLRVRTLDEVLLVIRKASGLRFDERLHGFHMYGTDICLEAEKRGLRNYAVPCFLYHNSNGIRNLPWAFWQACHHIRRKWWSRLPVRSPCTVVTRWPIGTIRQMTERFLLFNLKRRTVGKRVANPAADCAELERSGAIPPLS
jgi:glycosyltransferase involved in cell wall biosynthesis